MASTPFGMRGRFWELRTYGVDVLKVSVTGWENPRIPAAFLERVGREKGDAYLRQEFGCEFVENGVYLIGLDDVDGLVKSLR